MANVHKKILLVDDEPLYRILVYKKFKALGYQIVLAQNGEEALMALWEKQDIGLVLLDIRLPFMNGFNIFEIIRKDFPDKKVIVSSSLQKDEQQFLIYEADDYYYKGEDLDTLVGKVDRIFNNKSRIGTFREKEKRTFRRIPVNVFASCESLNKIRSFVGTHFFSYTKDLSQQGCRFVVTEVVKAGQHFSASLELPVNFLPLLIDCEVVWVRKLGETDPKTRGSYEVGVRFVKLDSPQDEEKLKNYFNYV